MIHYEEALYQIYAVCTFYLQYGRQNTLPPLQMVIHKYFPDYEGAAYSTLFLPQSIINGIVKSLNLE